MTDPRSPGAGVVIASRYRILSLLGQGGFGCSYLAEDQNRFGERCVLKEFAPQLQGTQALQKAKALFQREAGILYRLQHPQIPAFRELLQTEIQGQERLFLVQQYIPGQTYLEQLEQGLRWTEVDAVRFLRYLLPVLDYLHSQGILHRDIAPDNLICEATHQWPVLIDFGAVKQLAISVIQQFSPQGRAVATVVAKPGYTPPEQQYGQPVAASDLYALGVTTLVLLTGRSPAELRDRGSGAWNWQSLITVSPALTRVLETLLAERVCDRYPSAQAVLADLEQWAGGGGYAYPVAGGPSPSLTPAQLQPQSTRPSLSQSLSQLRTLAVAPRRPVPPALTLPPPTRAAVAPAVPSQPHSHLPRYRWFGRLLGLLLLPLRMLFKALLALMNWSLRGLFACVAQILGTVITKLIVAAIGVVLLLSLVGGSVPQWSTWLGRLPAINGGWPARSTADANCQERILTDMQARQIPASERSRLYAIVDAQFYAAYPDLEGRQLTNTPADAPLRRAWCEFAKAAIAAY
ncbi:serine/threonine protein kinase [Trichothermofontia sichuanensis B231]|uniref:serine/threonine-protein kinase n=1 Tax=Trichothermofontia sichuanensis TaxID=3045816 RepID=UPI00224797C2|nr:serine/threonine-protein kinase [Trichothermofontia sichuanensis]UZQ53587.1 serine/threonine protein kinase [Trichothermofontia sichuanensis B231]